MLSPIDMIPSNAKTFIYLAIFTIINTLSPNLWAKCSSPCNRSEIHLLGDVMTCYISMFGMVIDEWGQQIEINFLAVPSIPVVVVLHAVFTESHHVVRVVFAIGVIQETFVISLNILREIRNNIRGVQWTESKANRFVILCLPNYKYNM